MDTETTSHSRPADRRGHGAVWHIVSGVCAAAALGLLGGCASYDAALKMSTRLENDAGVIVSDLNEARKDLDQRLEEYRVAVVRAWTVKSEGHFWNNVSRAEVLPRLQKGYELAVGADLPPKELFSLWQGPPVRSRKAVDDAKRLLIADLAHPFGGPAIILGATAYITRLGPVQIAVLRPVDRNPGQYTVVAVSDEVPAFPSDGPWRWWFPDGLTTQRVGESTGRVFVARGGDVPAILCPEAAEVAYTEYPVASLGETLTVSDIAASAVAGVDSSLAAGSVITMGSPLARAYSFALLAVTPPGDESSPALLLEGSQVTPSALPSLDARVLARGRLDESKQGLEEAITSTLEGLRSARGDPAAIASASKEEKKRIARDLAGANDQVRAKLGEAPPLLAAFGSAQRDCTNSKTAAAETSLALRDDLGAERAAYGERWRRLRKLAVSFTTLDPTGYAGSALVRREGRLTATSGAAIVAESLAVEDPSRFIGARALLRSQSPGRVVFLVVRPAEDGSGFTVVDVTEPLTGSPPQVVELPASGDGPAHYLVEWTFAKELAAARGDRIAFWFADQTDVLADHLGSDAWVGGSVSGSPSAGMLLTREPLRAEGSVEGPRVSVSAGFLGYTPTPDKTPASKATGSP